MSQAGSRPLAPAPPPSTGVPSDLSPSGSSVVGQAAGIKRASTACQSCKQIKRKCDQAQPCSNCRKSNTLCTYNEADDGRRKAARKRTVESLELKRDALDSILESLRHSDDQHVQALIRLIRSQAPLEDVVQYATKNANSLPESQLQSIKIVVHGHPRKTVLSVNDLCDTPLVKVPSKPWTAVTEDDEFVSHLVSIYFTWFHIAYPVVAKDLFLDDMAQGKLDCQFCSPLLVNAILSMACHFSDHPRACKTPSDATTRGRHFLDEAVRQWTEQEGRLDLLNIQAVSIMAVSSTLAGKDRLSLTYLEQVDRMQHEFLFKSAWAEARGTQATSPDAKQSHQLTARTTFLLTVGYGSAFMQPLAVKPPIDHETYAPPALEQSLRWFPYPQQSPEMLIAFNDLHKAHYDLHKIGFDIQRFNFVDKSTPKLRDVKLLDQRLQDWKHGLPQALLLDSDISITKPPIMDLHLVYHWFRITLFNFIKTPRSTPATPPDQMDPVHGYARSHTLSSAKSIADLGQRYARDFGLKQPTIWMPQTSLSAAHSIIDDLSDQEQGTLVQDIFHELCLVLVAASQRWLVMRGHVRMLFVTAEEKGHKLPERTKALLKFVALDRWGDMDHLQFASASYPNYSLAKDEDPRLTAMGDLLEKWANYRGSEAEEEALVENAHALASESWSPTSTSTTTQGTSVMPNRNVSESTHWR